MSESNADLVGLVERSRAGDAVALEQLVLALRDGLYRLALRMTACPEDAEDATQEILIKVMTRLDSFRGDAAVTTWAYRVATNHLLDRRKSPTERLSMTFSRFAEDLLDGLSAPSETTDPERELLAHEVKQGCTLALLTCLDRDLRIAYVLGEILEVPSPVGAEICSISEPAYRKRLSRARQRIRTFLDENCGLVNPDSARCRCRQRVSAAKAAGRIAGSMAGPDGLSVEEATAELDTVYDATQLMRSRAGEHAPVAVTDHIVQLIQSRKLRVLD